MKHQLLLVSALAASTSMSSCANRTEAAESAGTEGAVRYCTLCARTETAATFCQKEESGKSVCLSDVSGRVNSSYCNLAAAKKEGSAHATRCDLKGDSGAGVQCVFMATAGRPAAEYSIEYCISAK